MRLSRLQTATLLAVAKYRFLTNSQLVMVGLAKLRTVQKATRYLASHPPWSPILHVQKYPVQRRLGRIEHVYSLSKAGKEIIAEKYPETMGRSKPGRASYDVDFYHRRACISFQMLLDRSLSRENPHLVFAESFDQYFHMTGANHRTSPGTCLRSKTRIEFQNKGFFIPDCIFTLRNRTHQKALFAGECVFGNKTTRTLLQIKKHMKAMSEGVVTEKYHAHGQDYVALVFFHDAKLMQRVMNGLIQNPKWQFRLFRDYFLFATVADVERDIQNCWINVEDTDYRYNFISGQKTLRIS